MMAAVREAWAIFQRRYCRMESPAVFSVLHKEFCKKPFGTAGAAISADDLRSRITAFVWDMAEKAPKENMEAAAMAEYGYGRESEMDRIPVVISKAPEKNSRTGSGIPGIFWITRIRIE